MNKLLLRHCKRAYGTIALTILLGLLGVGATIAQMVFLSKVVNAVFLVHETLIKVGALLLLLPVLFVVRALMLWWREVTAQQAASHVKSTLREQLFAHLLALGPGYSKGENTGELVTTLSVGIERLDAYVSRYLPQLVLSVGVPLIIEVYIFPLDWLSAVLLLITAPIIPLMMVLVGSYAQKHVQEQWLVLSRMGAAFLDGIQGLPTLKVFGRSKAMGDKVERLSNAFGEKTLNMLRMAFLSGMVLEFMVAAAIGVVAVTLGVRVIDGSISFENAFLVLLLTPEFYRPLRDIGQSRHAAMEGKAAAQRISDILETPLPLQSLTLAEQQPSAPLTITFTNVTYSYPNAERPAVSGVNLTLEAGSSTAVVGRSGAGKSSLVNLLLRFMDAQSGCITVNDVPITALPIETWRDSIALVPQRPYLFNDTVLANIRMARPTATQEEIIQAAELAHATEFIQQLPHGYETQIGERGARLSAGQAQRIAIARAFLKDAPLLILDEPTSSLDPGSERLIAQALERLTLHRTVLIIAHRYNTIAQATQVAIMEHGIIVAVGEPATLLRQDGTFTTPGSMDRKTQVAL